MPTWKIENGRPVKVTVRNTLPPPEVSIETEVTAEGLVCPECGKEYRTERGLAAHIEGKH